MSWWIRHPILAFSIFLGTIAAWSLMKQNRTPLFLLGVSALFLFTGCLFYFEPAAFAMSPFNFDLTARPNPHTVALIQLYGVSLGVIGFAFPAFGFVVRKQLSQ